MIVSLITQNVGMAVCSVLLYFIMAYEAQTPPFEDMGFVGLFILFNICGSIAALASMAESIAVGRDWVVVLANKDSEILAGTFFAHICFYIPVKRGHRITFLQSKDFSGFKEVGLPLG